MTAKHEESLFHVLATKVAVTVAVACVLSLGAVVIYGPHDAAKDLETVHKDLAKLDQRLDRIETLLLERK